MGDIIWGTDFRAKSRQAEKRMDQEIEQQMIRELMAMPPWSWGKQPIEDTPPESA